MHRMLFDAKTYKKEQLLQLKIDKTKHDLSIIKMELSKAYYCPKKKAIIKDLNKNGHDVLWLSKYFNSYSYNIKKNAYQDFLQWFYILTNFCNGLDTSYCDKIKEILKNNNVSIVTFSAFAAYIYNFSSVCFDYEKADKVIITKSDLKTHGMKNKELLNCLDILNEIKRLSPLEFRTGIRSSKKMKPAQASACVSTQRRKKKVLQIPSFLLYSQNHPNLTSLKKKLSRVTRNRKFYLGKGFKRIIINHYTLVYK